MNQGLIWRVGNGENINLTDLGLSNMPGFKVQMIEGTPMRINKVNELLLHNPTRWSRELIDMVFNPFEVNIIQQIPLAQGNIPDSITKNLTLEGHIL